ncbi:Cell division protein FtsL [Vibrio stylophorae]|uniref:Cell division protein FtsL n=1 Tax=Vibrio stylophorae TaxID=659351 RepID=A0ABM8ZWS8_9VIBR|nr:cell division protein FtsL [Vibrio stylophorae]CAH0534456.1 Cell division protein FtsL [Vibrio stylophorae]
MKPARHPSLLLLIARDLKQHGLVALFLLLATIAVAFAVVDYTRLTRSLITERDQLLFERDALDNEWRNQLLEEHALADHSRIDTIARDDLGFIRPNSANEKVVRLP